MTMKTTQHTPDLWENIQQYESILEYLPQAVNNNILTESPLYNQTVSFLEKYNISHNILISLSGGVDSMVLLDIFVKIRDVLFTDLNIYCVHINYNNREESVLERNFLIEYCHHSNVHFEFIDLDFTRSSMKRSTYESDTRNIRYKSYKTMCELYHCAGVFLAHHKDDICENIFNNIMRGGREITDLSVIKPVSDVLGVTVYRPMIDFYKKPIIEIAHRFTIPYFLDTTPQWSCRGHMRQQIFPACENTYSDNYKNNLIKLGKESDELNRILHQMVIDPFFTQHVQITSPHFSIVNHDNALCNPAILKIILRKIAYSMQIPPIKYTNVLTLSNLLENKQKKCKLSLTKNYITTISDNTVHFTYTISSDP